MKFLNTVHKRKSAVITTIILILLLLLMFFFGLRYMDPPIESGIAVNFGTSEVGSGDMQPTEPIKSTPVTQEVEEQEEVVEEEIVEASVPDESPSEDVLTNDSDESLVIKKKEEQKRKEALAIEAERIAKEEADKQAEAERVQKEQDAKKQKLDALMGGLNASEGTASGGEGDDAVAGDKGSVTGDPNAKGYYGKGGGGGNGDYQLGNRRPLSKPKPVYECNEEGLVVVSIEVDRNGKVIKATPGVKGTTNRASCLLLKAQDAAMKTKWEPDDEAASKQIGIIKYRFTLTN